MLRSPHSQKLMKSTYREREGNSSKMTDATREGDQKFKYELIYGEAITNPNAPQHDMSQIDTSGG